MSRFCVRFLPLLLPSSTLRLALLSERSGALAGAIGPRMAPRANPAPIRQLRPLSVAEVQMLRSCPYDEPGEARGPVAIKRAEHLIELGLLERDPLAKGFVIRCTSEGMAEAKPLSLQGAKRLAEHASDLFGDDYEAAESVMRGFWRRAMIDVVLADNVRDSATAVLVCRAALLAEGE